jgi:hypothetical protein
VGKCTKGKLVTRAILVIEEVGSTLLKWILKRQLKDYFKVMPKLPECDHCQLNAHSPYVRDFWVADCLEPLLKPDSQSGQHNLIS